MRARVERGGEQARRLDVVPAARPALVVGHGGEPGWDDEELGGDEVELGGEREEAGVEGGLGLGLLEGFAVVEVGVGEDAAEAAGERGEVAVGGGWDGEAERVQRLGSAHGKSGYGGDVPRGEGGRGVEERGRAVQSVQDIVYGATLLQVVPSYVNTLSHTEAICIPPWHPHSRGRRTSTTTRQPSSQDKCRAYILAEA